MKILFEGHKQQLFQLSKGQYQCVCIPYKTEEQEPHEQRESKRWPLLSVQKREN